MAYPPITGERRWCQGPVVPGKAVGLTAAEVRTAKPGRRDDGGGLHLPVRGSEARFWLFRYTMPGAMLGFAAVHGRCEGTNPARWRGHLDKLFPRRGKVRPG